MKLKSLNKFISLLIFTIISFQLVHAEEQIDIWKKENKDKKTSKTIEEKNISDKQNNSIILKKLKTNDDIKIDNQIVENSKDKEIFGIYDPAENDFNLDMWTQTDAEKVRSSFKRINKINLSNTATNLFEDTILSFAYPPRGMSQNEFVNLKIDWMINNRKIVLIEQSLKQNNIFSNKKKLIQYLVDSNIAKANIKEGCKNINFLDKNIKDAYLEKFKIYCLVFNNKINEAQLQLDILREEKQSENFLMIKLIFF